MDQINLIIKRKGGFPYDWNNSWDIFEKTSLPQRFYCKADYEHAQVWQNSK